MRKLQELLKVFMHAQPQKSVRRQGHLIAREHLRILWTSLLDSFDASYKSQDTSTITERRIQAQAGLQIV